MRRGIMMLLGAVLLVTAAGGTAAQTQTAPPAQIQTPTPTDAQRREKMLRALDSLDRAETLALLTQAFDCAARRDFACGKEKLAKAGRFAATDEERKLVERAGQTVTMLETATRETESARQELSQVRQAEAAAQAAQAESARHQQALNWRLIFVTDWSHGSDSSLRTHKIACGTGEEVSINETRTKFGSTFTPHGRTYSYGLMFNSREEAARHGCS